MPAPKMSVTRAYLLEHERPPPGPGAVYAVCTDIKTARKVRAHFATLVVTPVLLVDGGGMAVSDIVRLLAEQGVT